MKHSIAKSMFLCRPAFLAVLLFSAFTWGAARVEAQVLTCGQTVTTNVTLTADLLDCPSDGLIIGANNILVNLNGRTIDGVGLGVGVRNDGFDNVKIGNGTITQFDYGIQLNPGTTLNVLEQLTVTLNEFGGVELSDADNNTISGNTISFQSKIGLRLSNFSSGNQITGNTIVRNEDGLVLDHSNTNTILNNAITNSSNVSVRFVASSSNSFKTNTVSDAGDTGMSLEAGSNSNDVESNTFRRVGDGAVSVSDSNDNWVELNNIADQVGDSGLRFIRANGNQILGNTVQNASDCGISLEFANNNTVRSNNVRLGPCGIDLSESDNNLVELNDASQLSGTGVELGKSFSNTISANIVSGDARGIYVVDVAAVGAGNTIAGNTASSNNGNGITIASAGHTVTGNTANSNNGWGIYAVEGTTDGGGNRASGNTEPTQCFGVVCTP